MNTASENNRYLKKLRDESNAAEKVLQEAVAELCPGQHIPIQRRDGNPPWCRLCGRTARGTQIRTGYSI